MNFLIQLAAGVGLQILGYLLAPKPATQKPAETSDLKSPTAQAGRPVTVVFGSMTISGPNIIGMTDKQSVHRKAKVSKK